MRLSSFSDSDDEESQHLFTYDDHLLGPSIPLIQASYVFDHLSHSVPEEVVNMQKLKMFFSWRQRKCQIFGSHSICIYYLFVNMLDSGS
jgi:hypothetical protein